MGENVSSPIITHAVGDDDLYVQSRASLRKDRVEKRANAPSLVTAGNDYRNKWHIRIHLLALTAHGSSCRCCRLLREDIAEALLDVCRLIPAGNDDGYE
jgi:hypothetical protein